ncbi:isoaspartyl peptidase/L-asparaginase family protein [Desulfovermiculus halophilus]|uniref:isoaspartyl peptidase/L-asparaginase family protein n=1 Tax=Desulfovermiculus halophilus TaxID=339722 RepID=UPI00048058A1|nr:isoaspartyl peptidase/L-asparaginase [Desulfovermiculus halophilus]
MNSQYVLCIHGGCEDIVPERFTAREEQEHLSVLRQSLQAGRTVLEAGGTAVDATESAVMVLEDSPLFNAGRGSVFTHQGTNEMDASIMNGRDLQAGAVAGTSRIQNPVRAARLVMDRSAHVLLIGEGAEAFAREQGLHPVDPEYFATRRRWEEYVQAGGQNVSGKGSGVDAAHLGTVGAVCLDRQGNVAASSSTGGTMNKTHGRVGDSPLIGAGTYANNATCAVACTGEGEYFIRTVAAHRVSVLIELGGLSLEQACDQVLSEIKDLGGMGGMIAVDPSGHAAAVHLTQGMFRGLLREGEEPRVAMYGSK